MMGDPEELPKDERVPQLQGVRGDVERPISVLGVVSLVLGIVGLAFFWFPIFGQPLSILAVIFGWISLRQVSAGLKRGRGYALAGVILGVIGILVLASLLIIGTMVSV